MSMLFVNESDFQEYMRKAQVMYLATSQNDYVTSRPVSPVNMGMTLYFYTDDHSLKAEQMRANPRVAVCVGPYQIEGRARFLKHPTAPKNGEILGAYREKFGETFKDVSSTVVFVSIEITRISQWFFENGEPVNIAEVRY